MKTRFFHLAFLVPALAGLGACRRHAPPPPPPIAATTAEVALPELTIAEVARRLDAHETLAVFDANNRTLYEAGHVPSAHWVSARAVQASELPADHDTPLVFYCHNEA